MAVFTGTSGNDTFVAPSGSSTINGLGSVDTVSFNFRLVDATFSWVGNQVIIDTPTSHIVLTGVEIYQFTDGTVNEDDGNPLVDDLYYYSTYHDVWDAGVDADAHYNTFGWHEGRNPNAFFDTQFYLSVYADVKASGVNPLTQYDQTGWTENRDPSLNFDTSQYLAANSDVAAAHTDPLAHFLAYGAQEGRQPFPTSGLVASNGFDYVYYLTNNPDVAAAHVDPFVHFETFGWKEGRNPSAYFDTQGYLATYSDVAAAGVNPLDHYFNFGWKEGRDPSPAFNSQQYLLHNPDVAAAGVDPLTHFLQFGINEGRVAYADPVFDTNSAANTVVEAAANGTQVGLSASWGGWISSALSFSLGSDSSGGGFGIDPTTGLVTVADSTKLDFETSGAAHAYTIVVVAHDGTLSSSQSFTIGVGDVIPSTPADANAAANSVAEGAAAGTAVGITLSSIDPNGPPTTYSLTDDAGGRFAVDSATGVVSVANPSLLDFETSGPSHQFTISALATAGAITTGTQTFTITVTDAPPTIPVDSNGATNTVLEGSANGTLVGLTASSSDPNGPAATFSLTDSAGGRFAINSSTGVVTVANGSLVDFESAPGHAYSITVQATSGGLSSSQTFSIAVGDVAPAVPADADGNANSVLEGAANGTAVGLTVSSSDVNGGALTYSLTDSAGGRFAINASTGVVTVANGALLDFETATSHTITAQVSDGTLTSSQTFNIAVTDVVPSTPVDNNGPTGGTVAEGAANGTAVGVTVFSADPNGPAANYALTNNAGGRFAIDPSTGVVTVANAALIDFESSGGSHSYTITAQATAGALSSATQDFLVAVSNVAPTTPVDNDGVANSVAEGAAVNTTVGITASSTDINGPAVSYTLVGDTSGGGFKINSSTGVVSVADPTKIDFESSGVAHSYDITVQSSDGAGGTSTQAFTIGVTNVAPTQPTDAVAPTGGTIVEGATTGVPVGVTASSTDINGGAVTYRFFDTDPNPLVTSLSDGGGRFQINSVTGEVSVSAFGAAHIDYETAPGHAYSVTIEAFDGTDASTTQTFTIDVTNAAPSTPIDGDTSNANTIQEGVAAGVYTGLTASSTDPSSASSQVTYSLADTLGGRFAINATSGAISTGASANLIDFEASGGSYTLTVIASDNSGAVNSTSSQSFAIAVTNANPATPTDGNPGTPNIVAEGIASGQSTGLTVQWTDPGTGPALTYTLIDDAGGRFQILDSATGVVTTGPNASQIDFELSGGSYQITAQADDGAGGISTQAFTINVSDVAPTNWTDINGGSDTVVEGAAHDALVGVTAHATDVNGGTVVYSFANSTDSAGGRFKIDSSTGAISVDDQSLVDFESATGHQYTVTVTAGTVGGTATSTNPFTIDVGNVPPPQPVDISPLPSDPGPIHGTVVEGDPATTAVGITAHSDDINGGTVTYLLTNDAAGLFTINASGVISVTAAGATGIDYESTAAAGHTYTVTVQASDGTATSTQNFVIGVTNAAPFNLIDSNLSANVISTATAVDGGTVDITLLAQDHGGGGLTYSLTDSGLGDHFEITAGNASSGIVTIKNAAGLTPGTTYHIVGQASDGLLATTAGFDIDVFGNVLTLDLNSGVSGFGNTQFFTEQDPDLAITTLPSITNPGANPGNPGVGNATSASAVLTNAKPGDDLKVNGSAAASGTLNIGGETIHWTKTVGAGQITVNLTDTATYDHYESALQLIKFSNPSDALDATTRTINVTVTDATGTSNSGNPSTDAITVTSVNDTPDLTPHGPLTGPGYTENLTPSALLAGGAVNDPDSPANFGGGSFKIAIANPFAGDQIIVTGAGFAVNGTSLLFNGVGIGTISGLGTYSSGTYIVEVDLNTNATGSVVNSLVQAFSYQSVSQNPDTTQRSITLTFNDGGNSGTTGGPQNSNVVTETVTVTAVNDPPVALNDSKTTNENTILSTSVPTATDVDGTIDHYVLDSNVGAGNGNVVFNSVGTYDFDPGTDFDNLAAGGSRSVSFTYHAVDDGAASSSPPATVTINVTGLNDAPTVSAATLAAVNEDTTASTGQTVATIFTGHFIDIDIGSSLKGIAISANAAIVGQGAWQYSTDNGANWFAVGSQTASAALLLDANARLRFVPAPDFSGTPGSLTAFGLDNTFDSGTNPFTSGVTTGTFDVATTHGGTSAVSDVGTTVSISITAVNDAPVITNLNGNLAFFAEGGPAVLLDSGTPAAVTDVDSPDFDTGTLTVAITSNQVNTEDVLGIRTAGQIAAAAGVITFGGTQFATYTGGAGGSDLIITFDADATQPAVSELLQNLTYNNTNATTASLLTRAVSITLTDGDGGAGTTTVNTSVAVSEPVSADGQLWYLVDDLGGSDNYVGHVNVDLTSPTSFPVTTEFDNDIAVDKTAGFYFVLDSQQSLTPYAIAAGHTAGTSVTVGAAGAADDAVALDPAYHTIFVSTVPLVASTATTGIVEYSYNTTTGVLTPGSFLINQDTVPSFVQAIDISLDVANRLLYYVDDDAATSNGIYVVNYANGATVATVADAPTATLLVQFAVDGTAGFIESVAVDNRGTASTGDDIIYFLTNDVLVGAGGTASLWYLDRSGGNTTPALLGTPPSLAGASTHTGLTFDQSAHQLYVSSQDFATATDAIIQIQLDATGHNAQSSTSKDLPFLTNGAPPEGAAVPGQTALTLPLIAVHAGSFTEVNPTSTATAVDPAAIILMDPAATVKGATVTMNGGFAGDGDQLSFVLPAGITGPSSPVLADAGGNVTLIFIGDDTAAHYQSLLQSIKFTSGDNPTNFGPNSSRTITWHLDVATANDAPTTANTQTSILTVVGANDAPTANDSPVSGNEDTPINGQAVATDPDNTAAQLTYSVVSGVNLAKGALVFNTADGSFTYLPNANFNGSDSFTFKANDGSGDSNTATVNITVNPVNDAPVVTATTLAAVDEDIGNAAPGETVANLFAGHFSDVDNGAATISGIAISGNTANAGTEGVWQYDTHDATGWHNVGSVSGAAALVLDPATSLRFVPVANYNGTPPALTAFGLDDTYAGGFTVGTTTVVPLNTGTNGGTTAISDDPTTISTSVTAVNDAPTLDLDDVPAGNNYTTTYAIGTAGVPIANPTHVAIGDIDDTNIAFATIDLTVGDASDSLALSGILPAGINLVIDPLSSNHIIAHLSGSASKASYQTAISQIVFATADPSATPAQRTLTVVVDDGHAVAHASAAATTFIDVTANAAPQAKDDTVNATEAGGTNNGTAGSNPSGNVITGTGTAGAVADTDTDGPPPITVIAVGTGLEGSANNGTVGVALPGTYGTLQLNSDGSYSYVLDNSNALVQALRTSTQLLTDNFTYTIQDNLAASKITSDGGLQTNSVATLAIVIHGANDNPTVAADTASATEAGGAVDGTAGVNPTGNVLTNDTDVDSSANGEIKTVQGVLAGSVGGPLSNANVGADVTGSFGKINIASDGSYTYTVDNLNATVRGLRTNAQTVTDTFSYTMHDVANAVQLTTQIVVTIHGQNDNPVAVADTASATEAGGTNNGTGGSNGSGNVLTNDTDQDTVGNGETKTVQGLEIGDHPSDVVTGGVGGAGITGLYGTLTINTNGAFTYVIDNTNATVQNLNAGGHVDDVFTYTMHDQDNVTSTAKLTIAVNGANDAPVALADGSAGTPFAVVLENRLNNVTTVNLLTNDSDVDTPNGNPINTPAANLTAVKNTDTANGGVVTVNANGTFSVNYSVSGTNYLGTDTFTYHANDGALNSGTVTVTIDVQPLIWYIDDSVGAVNDATHFTTIGAFNTANAAASASGRPDIIYIRHGDDGVYSSTDGVNLFNGQKLLGAGVDLSYAKTLGGTVILESGSVGQTPIISVTGGAGNAGVTLAQNNTLAGFNIAMNNADSIGIEDGGGTVGTLTVSGVAIGVDPDGGGALTGALGKAIDIDQNGTLAATFSSLRSIGSNSEGIQLGGTGAGNTLGGTFAVTGTTTVTDAVGNAIQVLNTATNASFNFGTSTTVSDTVAGGGSHAANGINLLTGIGNTNSFTFSSGGGALSITTDGGYGISANGPAAANNMTINVAGTSNTINANGTGLDLTNVSLGAGATFSSVTSNAGANGINIVNPVSGALTINGGTLSGHASNEINLSGGSNNFTYAGTVGNGSGNSVSIASKTGGTTTISGNINDTNDAGGGISLSNNTGGTYNFTGQSITLDTGASAGVNLATNGGTTINFNMASGGNGLDITTAAGAGFSATGGATAVNVTDPDGLGGVENTITSVGGTALNVTSTTIGASGLTFKSISANGGTNGIVLNTTGSSGGLTVTGDSGSAVNASGGIITASTGVGISLTSTNGVSLDQMTVSNGGNDGVNGSTVTNFSLTNSTVTGNGNAVGENGLEFANLLGTALISNTTVHNSFSDNFKIINTSGTLDSLNIKNSTFDQTSIPGSPAGGNGVVITMQNSAVMTDGSINNSTFRNNFSNGILVNTENSSRIGDDNATGSSTHGFRVANSTFDDNNIAIQFGVFHTSDLTVDVQNNSIINDNRTATSGANSTSQAIVVGTSNLAGTGSTLNARIDTNTIGSAAIGGSGSSTGSGIRAVVQGLADATILINNNTIRQAPTGFGIDAEFLGTPPANPGSPPTSDITITNNNIDHVNVPFKPGTSNFPGPAIYLAGDNQGTAATVRANVTGNVVPVVDGTHPATAQFTGAYLELYEYTGPNGILQLVDNAPASATALAELQSHNTGSIATGGGTIDLIAGPINTPPDLTPLPQLSALGEGPGAAATLTLDALAPIVQEAVHRWEAAGITQQQMAVLAGLQFGIANIGDGVLGQTIGHGRIVIDDNGAGWGWFVDPTPGNDSEFAAVHSSTEAAATSGDAAGGMDLLTVVMHEIGHLLGFEPSSAPGTLMDEALDLGMRRLPSAEDDAVVTASESSAAPVVQTPAPGQSATDTSVAETFVVTARDAPIHVADYSAAQGDTFDFSGLQLADATKVRAVEDAGNAFATLEIDVGAIGRGGVSASHWVPVAQLDGVHAGDAVDVWLNPAQVAHLHAGLLG